MVTYLAYHEKEYIWEALLVTYNMYLCQGFHITMISGDQEFSALNALTTVLPTAPCLDWVAASQHYGLIEHNICFLKEKIHLLCQSLLFTMVPGIVVVHMVLHIIKFDNEFPCRGGVKHFSHGEIMTGCRLHKSNIALSFGVYCHVAENVQPRNSLAPWMEVAILVGSLGNLSDGQVFLVLDTGHTTIRHQWVALPMPPAVIDRINLLGWHEPAMLTFTNGQGRDIGDSNPQDANSNGILDDYSIIIYPAVEITRVDRTTDLAEIARVDPDFDVKPKGVDMDTNVWSMDTNVPVDDNAIAIDGLKQHDPTEGAAAVPNAEPTTNPKKVKSPVKKVASPKTGMAAQNSPTKKAREKYVPSMKGNNYVITLTQIKLLL
jgi:hypothetical protein